MKLSTVLVCVGFGGATLAGVMEMYLSPSLEITLLIGGAMVGLLGLYMKGRKEA